MAVRHLYPHPECPCCGTPGLNTYIKTTFYTENQEIIRYRRCRNCDHRWFTYQEPEMSLDPSQYQVVHPDLRGKTKKQVVLLKKL